MLVIPQLRVLQVCDSGVYLNHYFPIIPVHCKYLRSFNPKMSIFKPKVWIINKTRFKRVGKTKFLSFVKSGLGSGIEENILTASDCRCFGVWEKVK